MSQLPLEAIGQYFGAYIESCKAATVAFLLDCEMKGIAIEIYLDSGVVFAIWTDLLVEIFRPAPE